MNTHVHTHTHTHTTVINQDDSQVICPVFLKIKKLEELSSYHCHHFLLRKHHRLHDQEIFPLHQIYFPLSNFIHYFQLPFQVISQKSCFPLLPFNYFQILSTLPFSSLSAPLPQPISHYLARIYGFDIFNPVINWFFQLQLVLKFFQSSHIFLNFISFGLLL